MRPADDHRGDEGGFMPGRVETNILGRSVPPGI